MPGFGSPEPVHGSANQLSTQEPNAQPVRAESGERERVREFSASVSQSGVRDVLEQGRRRVGGQERAYKHDDAHNMSGHFVGRCTILETSAVSVELVPESVRSQRDLVSIHVYRQRKVTVKRDGRNQKEA